MSAIRTLLALVAIVLTGFVINASFQANLFESFTPIAADPWGFVSLLDLYAGFLAFATLVWLLEPDRRIGILVIVALFILGNPVSLFWLVARLGAIRSRLGH